MGIASTLAPDAANAGTTPAGSVNVTNYSAVADGVTNDAGAIQAAIHAAGDACRLEPPRPSSPRGYRRATPPR